MRHESPGMAFDLVAPTLSFDLLAFLVAPPRDFTCFTTQALW